MEENYDVVICGTGLKECILAALLSHSGKRVLQIDEEKYYGSENASLNLTNLFEKFAKNEKPPKDWGANRDWNIDLIPKFIMAKGKLTDLLILTGVKEYLQFQVVEGSFVYQHQSAGWFTTEKFIHKVPASDTEALNSSLIPAMEKLRGKSFFVFVANFDPNDPKTWIKGINNFDPHKTTMKEVFKFYNINPNVVDFVGHSIALYPTDLYLFKPMAITMQRLKLYMHSLVRYGKSPFIYPMYGLGSLSEGFSRMAAVFGCTYMLQTPFKGFVYDQNARVNGVVSADGSIARCKMVICDPAYAARLQADSNTQNGLMREKVKRTGRVARVINILNAPIPSTNGRSSCQIILPQKQLKRTHDIYLAMISSDHGVCPTGKYVAIVSSTVETDDPVAELKPALELLGPIEKQFVHISDTYKAMDDGTVDKIFVPNSYDASSHFESAIEDVLQIWKNIHGKDFDLSTEKPAWNAACHEDH